METPAQSNSPGLSGDTKYDLVVIGSGPAGEKGAAQAAYFGKRVALVEKEAVLGGTATNAGALPSKTLRESALFLSGHRHRNLFGINVSLKDRVTMRDFLYRERIVQQSERLRILENLRRHKVEVLRGQARLADAHTVIIKPKRSPELRVQADKILLATGSAPRHPPELPFHDMRVFDTDNVLQMPDLPPSLLVVGCGPVACNYLSTFAVLGIKVYVVSEENRLFPSWDQEIVAALLENLASLGIEIIYPDAIAGVQTEDVLQVKLRSGKNLSVHALLAAAGRVGNTKDLGLEAAGIRTDAHGFIAVNPYYQTSVPNIYAAGDVVGPPALAAIGMEQARVAMVHAFDLKYKTRMANVLAETIYAIPECAMAGETEENLQRKNVPFLAGKAFYHNNARGLIVGEKNGFVKLLFHAEDLRLLGAHIIGEQASELIHVGLEAILMNATADLFIQTCFNYPTLGELYKYATYDALDALARRATGQ